MDSIYSGMFGIAVGLYDVKIDFYTVEPTITPDGQITDLSQEVAQRITLPISLAKELSIKLQETVNAYESNFGEVKSIGELTQIAEASMNNYVGK